MEPTPQGPSGFEAWRRQNISDKMYIFMLAMAVGLMAGMGAYVLKFGVSAMTTLVGDFVHPHGFNWLFLIVPLLGIVITSVYVRYVVRDDVEHGVSLLLDDYRRNQLDLSSKLMYAPLIGNSITLGFGGSGGSEGPIAYASAAMASNLGRWLNIPAAMMPVLIGAGAGGGISAIFKAPIGGVLFTLEVLQLPMTTTAVIALVICCLTADLTAYLLSGCTFDVSFDAVAQFPPDLIPYALLLGFFCGVYSWFYMGTSKRMEEYLASIKNPWKRCIISGSVLAALVFLFPELYGDGYTLLDKVINDYHTDIGQQGPFFEFVGNPWALMAVVFCLMLVKGVAVSSTNSGGGVAGDFAPTLFAGCLAGLLFGLFLNHVFHTELPVGHFALMGMGAVMAGAIKAPLMAMFICVEMTDAFGFLLPVALASLVSYCVACMLMPRIIDPRLALHHRRVGK